MLLRQIKYFVTVVDTGSFTEAAEECFISQSAISQQILSLEKELGVQLLVRSTRRFTLTEPGKYLYSHGKKLLGETEKLKNGTIAAAAGQEGSLKVCYLNSFADARLYKAVSMFKQQNAGVRLNVSGGAHYGSGRQRFFVWRQRRTLYQAQRGHPYFGAVPGRQAGADKILPLLEESQRQ